MGQFTALFLMMVRMMFSATTAAFKLIILGGPAPSNPSGSNITNIVDGFAWIENLWFDGQGGLFFSDFYAGTLYKATRNATTGQVFSQVWAHGDNWKKVLGIAAGLKPDEIYLVVVFTDGSSGIVTVNINAAETYALLVKTPKSGNGLAYNPTTSWLYACNEGDFVPCSSQIMSINVGGGPNDDDDDVVVKSQLFAQDGAFVDVESQKLYTTNLVEGKICMWDISDPKSENGLPCLLGSYYAPTATTLDDICVNGSLIYAADFLAGKVLRFNADGSSGNTVTVASGFHAVTSVRYAVGPGWGPCAANGYKQTVMVSEGGALSAKDTNRGIWEVAV